MFADRREWFEHELNIHRLEWRCLFCTHTPFESLAKLELHMRNRHVQNYIGEQLPALTIASQKSLDRIPAGDCPMCDDWESTLREANLHVPPSETLVVTLPQFRQHLGAHMEQLALFAIPRGHEDENNADSDGAAGGITDEDEDDNSRIDFKAWDESTADPPLHIAAFEGREADVLELIDDGADVNSSGETWGNALQAAAKGGHYNILIHLLSQGAITDSDEEVDKIRSEPAMDKTAERLLSKFAPSPNVSKKWQDAVEKLRKLGLLQASASTQTVSSGGQKISHRGKECDYVFNVDVQNGGPPLKLLYYASQSPREAARLFLQENNLSEAYLKRVARFILINRGILNFGNKELSDTPTLKLVLFVKEYQSLMSSLQAGVSIETAFSYKSVSVLLLFWNSAIENPDFENELESLNQILTDTYGYSVHRGLLKTDPMKLPQNQVKRLVRDFVFENDGPEDLQIVYYMGHSAAGQLSGSQRPLMYVRNLYY